MSDPKRLTSERLAAIEEFVGGSMMPPLYANELLAEIRAAWRERDEATASDEQCEQALLKIGADRDQLREQVKLLESQLEQKSGEIGRAEHRGNTVDYIYDKLELYSRQLLAVVNERDALQARVGKLREALAYYANEKNWYPVNNKPDGIRMVIASIDTEGQNWLGGRTARLVLAADAALVTDDSRGVNHGL